MTGTTEHLKSGRDAAASYQMGKIVDEHTPGLKAEWRFVRKDAQGNVLDDVGWIPNVICDTNGKLLAALCKGEASYSGITYLAVGTGESSWDTGGTPAPSAARETLVNELARKTVTISFLDGSNNTTASVTNRLEVSATFVDGEANGAHREFGLFGGDATATVDSGLMVNYRTQAVKNKGAGETLTITVRIIFA